MSCNCGPYPQSGNAPVGATSGNQYWIPLKVGFPLSSACERATVIGSIPEIIRYPGYTAVNGSPVVVLQSNGGISNKASFFKKRSGCYGNESGQVGGTNCA